MAASAEPTGLWQVGSGKNRCFEIFRPEQNAIRGIKDMAIPRARERPHGTPDPN
jgi:hypothetical protein